MSAREIVKARDGRWYGRYGAIKRPAHDDREPSCLIKNDLRKRDGIDVNCLAGCDKAKVEKTRLFIPSKVTDNRYLDDSYVASLFQVGSAELVRAWLEGDWSVVQGAFFDGWSQSNIVRPFEVPSDWFRFRSVDWGSARPSRWGGGPYPATITSSTMGA
jgi:hypothetical protein